MKSLLLTLGHNSSAILIEDNRLVWGYETERFSHVKSDSRFPEAVLNATRAKPDIVYVTHWAPTGVLANMGSKYWRPEFFDGVPIRSLDRQTSHHDTHMIAAMCYAGPSFPKVKSIGLVVDGFGTLGEHFSVYDLEKSSLIRRIHGYNTSLGLMYQYATAFMGMKMHEDEYKMLGYEVHISQQDYELLQPWIADKVDSILQDMSKSVYMSQYDPMYDLTALDNVRESLFLELTKVCKALDVTDSSSERGRQVLSCYAQSVLEGVVTAIVRAYKPENLLVSGGIFFNVKLNWLLMNEIEGKFCAYPLAGDQGNALGLYASDCQDFVFPSDLFWGKRRLFSPGLVPGMEFFKSEEAAVPRILALLKTVGAVNVVRGAMEFGPRALCNTSTLAMPTKDVVERINRANGRNTVMPMAPVMTRSMYVELFEENEVRKVWKSHEHMIVAMEYKYHPTKHMLGAAHEYVRPKHCHTGRPQVTSDPTMVSILNEVGHPLINTSFNVHGRPIVRDMADAIENHNLQRSIDQSFRTVVVQNE